MKKLSLLVLLLASTAAFADDSKQCQKDCKDFIAQCEKQCDAQLKKKDPKMVKACQKNCTDFAKECEKGCANGSF
jgi:hypothetical protein